MMDDSRGAGVRIPPPVVFILFIFCALGLSSIYPIDIHFPVALAYSGVVISISGLLLLLYLATLFKRVKTNIEPWKPTTKIISTGIYAYSRNPIYLAFCTIPLGLGLFFSHIWLMLSVIPACISVLSKSRQALVVGDLGLKFDNLVCEFVYKGIKHDTGSCNIGCKT